jgi:hypothetical protein
MTTNAQQPLAPRKTNLLPRFLLILLLVIWFLVGTSCKLLTQATGFLLVGSAIVALFIRSNWSSYLVGALLAVWIITMIQPLDVAVRRGVSFRVRWVRVFQSHYATHETIIAQAKTNGLVENLHFVIYDCNAFGAPSHALLIQVK